MWCLWISHISSQQFGSSYQGFQTWVNCMITQRTTKRWFLITGLNFQSPPFGDHHEVGGFLQDLLANSKCSLLVAKDPEDRTYLVITIHGDALPVSLYFLWFLNLHMFWSILKVHNEDKYVIRNAYLARHPDAFWVKKFCNLIPCLRSHILLLFTFIWHFILTPRLGYGEGWLLSSACFIFLTQFF